VAQFHRAKTDDSNWNDQTVEETIFAFRELSAITIAFTLGEGLSGHGNSQETLRKGFEKNLNHRFSLNASYLEALRAFRLRL